MQSLIKIEALPTDMVLHKIQNVDKPLDLSLPENDPETEADVLEVITKVSMSTMHE